LLRAVVPLLLDCQHGTDRFFVTIVEDLAMRHSHEIHLRPQRVADLQLTPFDNRKHDSSQCIFWHRVLRLAVTHPFVFLSWIFANRLCCPRALWLKHVHFDAPLERTRRAGPRSSPETFKQKQSIASIPVQNPKHEISAGVILVEWKTPDLCTAVAESDILCAQTWPIARITVPFPLNFSFRPCYLYSSFGLPALLVVPTVERFL
jgi:hypothetical protein